MIYEVRYYFYGVPRDKHFGCRRFSKLSDAEDFAFQLDPYHVECYEILSIDTLMKVCISSNYCPQKSICKKCKYVREEEI